MIWIDNLCNKENELLIIFTITSLHPWSFFFKSSILPFLKTNCEQATLVELSNQRTPLLLLPHQLYAQEMKICKKRGKEYWSIKIEWVNKKSKKESNEVSCCFLMMMRIDHGGDTF